MSFHSMLSSAGRELKIYRGGKLLCHAFGLFNTAKRTQQRFVSFPPESVDIQVGDSIVDPLTNESHTVTEVKSRIWRNAIEAIEAYY